MGLLKLGRPLSWDEAAPHREYVREHGVTQFLFTMQRYADLANAPFKWGDELEYGVFEVGDDAVPRFAPRGAEILKQLAANDNETESTATWVPEFGAWMVEGTPREPYGDDVAHGLVAVETNMRARRAALAAVLRPGEHAPTLTAFPRLGCTDALPQRFGGDETDADDRAQLLSEYALPEVLVNPHPRFGALARSIRARRGGERVDIRVPLLRDERTPEFARAAAPLTEAAAAAPPAIHMDAMAGGMGMCCLQVTFQAADLDESRWLFDQLVPLAPLFLALTAATPALYGRLAATDVRWSALADSVDDRTPAERRGANDAAAAAAGPYLDGDASSGASLAGGGVQPIAKSRYDAVSLYLHPTSATLNDTDAVIDECARATLARAGVDDALARHVAHLFSRDPLVIFDGAVGEVDDATSTEHFENIQSTNWQTLRWKPPPPPPAAAPPADGEDAADAAPTPPPIGWRVEFRSMEVQLTDFENASFACFVSLLVRALRPRADEGAAAFDTRVPLSRVDENMHRAHARDAARDAKFWVRDPAAGGSDAATGIAPPCVERSLDAIFNGSGGLVPLVVDYLARRGVTRPVATAADSEGATADSEAAARVFEYVDFVAARAAGELPTAAAWIRSFVGAHPSYARDSHVPPDVAADLVVACDELARGRRPDLAALLVGDARRVPPLEAVARVPHAGAAASAGAVEDAKRPGAFACARRCAPTAFGCAHCAEIAAAAV